MSEEVWKTIKNIAALLKKTCLKTNILKLKIGLAKRILLPHITYIIILCVKSKSSKSQTVKKLWVGTISDRNTPKYDKQDLLKGTCILWYR